MKNINTKYKIGFTLVELLVVISIIGILSSIVYASFGDARKSARDDIRKTDLKSLQLAVELYKAQNGSYPRGDCSYGGYDALGPSSDCVEYISGLVPDFIAELPIDPHQITNSDHTTVVGYGYMSNGFDFKILALNSVELKTITSAEDEFARCPSTDNCEISTTVHSDFAKTYAVYSAGAANW